MAFTEQDLKNQQQEIARLADELKRLNSVFEAQKKELGIEGEVTLDDIEMTPALEQALACCARLAADKKPNRKCGAFFFPKNTSKDKININKKAKEVFPCHTFLSQKR